MGRTFDIIDKNYNLSPQDWELEIYRSLPDPLVKGNFFSVEDFKCSKISAILATKREPSRFVKTASCFQAVKKIKKC